MEFYISLTSHLVCAICARRCAKRVLRVLGTLLCALWALGGKRCAHLVRCNRRHLRCEIRNANIVVAFCAGSKPWYLIEGRATHRDEVANTLLLTSMLGKATPKIGDRVDDLIGNIQKKLYGQEGDENKGRWMSSTSGSILMFGSMLRMESGIDWRIVASLGVDLRRADDSSVTHVNSSETPKAYF